MNPTLRITAQTKDQLITLKRRTGLMHWNELCRWALCRSLAEATPLTPLDLTFDSNVEIDWRTLTGPDGDVYMALLEQRCAAEGLQVGAEDITGLLRRHVHRGVGYLAGDREMDSIEALVKTSIS